MQFYQVWGSWRWKAATTVVQRNLLTSWRQRWRLGDRWQGPQLVQRLTTCHGTTGPPLWELRWAVIVLSDRMKLSCWPLVSQWTRVHCLSLVCRTRRRDLSQWRLPSTVDISWWTDERSVEARQLENLTLSQPNDRRRLPRTRHFRYPVTMTTLSSRDWTLTRCRKRKWRQCRKWVQWRRTMTSSVGWCRQRLVRPLMCWCNAWRWFPVQ